MIRFLFSYTKLTSFETMPFPPENEFFYPNPLEPPPPPPPPGAGVGDGTGCGAKVGTNGMTIVGTTGIVTGPTVAQVQFGRPFDQPIPKHFNGLVPV